jgi:uncharacterized protein YbjT (DUF2867 family)
MAISGVTLSALPSTFSSTHLSQARSTTTSPAAPPSATKTILFLGATGGVGLSTLKHSLAAGHVCIALQRTPSNLLALLSPDEQQRVSIHEGNAHDEAVVLKALANPLAPGRLVDVVVFSIGGKPSFTLSGFTVDDPEVCTKGMITLLSALRRARLPAPAGSNLAGRPRIVGVSSTGITTLARDVPYAFSFLYHVLLDKPHDDKRGMERAMIASDEDFTIVRASLLTDGDEGVREVRVGLEDPIGGTVESTAVGYSVSRRDVGRWIWENVVEGGDEGRFVRKAATLTY